jgi:hypothetical protein
MSLFKLLKDTTRFVKVRFLDDKEVIDNVIFRCHYRVTSAILFVCCILCTAYSLIGGYHLSHMHELLALNPNEGCQSQFSYLQLQMLAY